MFEPAKAVANFLQRLLAAALPISGLEPAPRPSSGRGERVS